MTITEILQTLEAAAPWILAILVATTTLAHALARAARAFERWAATTPSPHDDLVARRAVRWADGAAAALDWISALLPRVGLGRVPTEAPPAPKAPSRRGPPEALVALLVAGSLVSGTGLLQACGGAQQALSAQAVVHRAHRAARVDYYNDLDAECGAQHETRDAYRECMTDARRIAQAADSYRHSLESAQAVLDAAGRETFEAMLPDLRQAATDLINALVAAGVPVPALVREVANLRDGGAS